MSQKNPLLDEEARKALLASIKNEEEVDKGSRDNTLYLGKTFLRENPVFPNGVPKEKSSLSLGDVSPPSSGLSSVIPNPRSALINGKQPSSSSSFSRSAVIGIEDFDEDEVEDTTSSPKAFQGSSSPVVSLPEGQEKSPGGGIKASILSRTAEETKEENVSSTASVQVEQLRQKALQVGIAPPRPPPSAPPPPKAAAAGVAGAAAGVAAAVAPISPIEKAAPTPASPAATTPGRTGAPGIPAIVVAAAIAVVSPSSSLSPLIDPNITEAKLRLPFSSTPSPSKQQQQGEATRLRLLQEEATRQRVQQGEASLQQKREQQDEAERQQQKQQQDVLLLLQQLEQSKLEIETMARQKADLERRLQQKEAEAAKKEEEALTAAQSAVRSSPQPGAAPSTPVTLLTPMSSPAATVATGATAFASGTTSEEALLTLQRTAERYKEEAEEWRVKFEAAQVRGVFHGPPSPARSNPGPHTSTGTGTGTGTGTADGGEVNIDAASASGAVTSALPSTPATKVEETLYNPLGSRSLFTPGATAEPTYTFEETATASPGRCCHA